MIQPVSAINVNNPTMKKEPVSVPIQKTRDNNVVDTFVKYTKESTPFLLGMTAFWSVYDGVTRKVPLTKSVPHNIVTLFLPVLLGTSLVMTVLESRAKSKANAKNNV